MLVQYRDGGVRMVINDYLVCRDVWHALSYYNDDLIDNDGDEYIDIVKVSCVLTKSDVIPKYWTEKTLNNNLLWERKEGIPEYTMEEAIKLVGHEFKIKKG